MNNVPAPPRYLILNRAGDRVVFDTAELAPVIAKALIEPQNPTSALWAWADGVNESPVAHLEYCEAFPLIATPDKIPEGGDGFWIVRPDHDGDGVPTTPSGTPVTEAGFTFRDLPVFVGVMWKPATFAM